MSCDVHVLPAQVADICQRLVGQTLTSSEQPEPDAFERLFADIGSPPVEAGRRTIDSTLQAFTGILARTIHANFHQRFPRSRPCDFRAEPFTMLRDPPIGAILVQKSLEAWARRLRTEFRAAHDSVAQRTRRALEASTAATSTQLFADNLGVGKRTLERYFRAEIGVSIAEYRTRVRLAAMVTALGTDAGCVESAVLSAGWTSKRSGYEALRERTGLTPAAVRALSRPALEGLVASLMIYGRAAHRCARCARYDCLCCPRHHSHDSYPVHVRQQALGSPDTPLTTA